MTGKNAILRHVVNSGLSKVNRSKLFEEMLAHAIP